MWTHKIKDLTSPHDDASYDTTIQKIDEFEIFFQQLKPEFTEKEAKILLYGVDEQMGLMPCCGPPLIRPREQKKEHRRRSKYVSLLSLLVGLIDDHVVSNNGAPLFI